MGSEKPAMAMAFTRALLGASIAMSLATPGAAAPKAPKPPKPPPPRYVFAGVPWLLPPDSVRARLAERGYRPVATASDSHQVVLRGKLFEHDALVTGHLDEQRRLVRWVVLVASRGEEDKWPDMRGVFDEVVQESESRYGPPRTVTERYRFPYQRGDGREDRALRDGLATIRRIWESKSGDRLTVEMDQNVSVVLTYESPEWQTLEKRRREKRASDL